MTSAAKWRAPEYDESYSIFLTAGDARPEWPAGIFQPASVRHNFTGHAGLLEIARDLRSGDVHPPLYFWTLEYWRRVFGGGWFAARMLSVLLSLATLICLGWAAGLANIAAPTAMLMLLLSYGFAYTGIIIRGFALAQLLNILGVALALSAAANGRRAWRGGWRGTRFALAAGLAFGAAAFTNYLAVFVGLATLSWLCLQPRPARIFLPALLGFVVFLPGLIFFFHAQQHSRSGQFQPFSLLHAIPQLAKDFGAALFGGLPVYAGRAGGFVTLALAALAAICAGIIIKNWRRELGLFAVAFAFVPAGLLALGIIFNNTPIEIRYLAFSLPFAALMLAATLTRFWACIFVMVEACGIIGLALAHSTMQPQALAARQIAVRHLQQALVLLPYGNDGVGIPGPFIAAAPDDLRLELIRPSTRLDVSKEQTIVLAEIRIDAASRIAVAETLAQLRADPCWAEQPSTGLLAIFDQNCGGTLILH